MLLIVRLISAFCMHISDCDETFNYWEPVSKNRPLLLTNLDSQILLQRGSGSHTRLQRGSDSQALLQKGSGFETFL